MFDQHDKKKGIYTIKGKDNWFDGESMSVYDIEKTEILTTSTYTKNMLQVSILVLDIKVFSIKVKPR